MRRRSKKNSLGVMLALTCLSLSGFLGCGTTETLGPEQPSEEMLDPAAVILLTGSFHDVSSSGSGLAEVLQAPDGTRTLRFTGFQTVSAPVLEVYMVAAADANDDQSVLDAGFVSLGALQSVSGDQTYAVPADLDLDVYRSVSIWCVSFRVNFATAPMSPFGT